MSVRRVLPGFLVFIVGVAVAILISARNVADIGALAATFSVPAEPLLNRPKPPAVIFSAASAVADPNDYPTSPSRNEGMARTQAGWHLLQSADFQRAATEFTKASRLLPRDASVFVGLGISQYRLSHDELAMEALNRALELDDNVPHAHALLGDLSFRRDWLEEAVLHYETAARQDPTDVMIQESLLFARQAYRNEAGLHRMLSSHFLVKFESSQRSLAERLIDRLEQLCGMVEQRLGYQPQAPLIVILYSDKQFAQLTGSPAWAGGLFDGRIHLASRTVLGHSESPAALAHECTHALVHRLSAGRLPTWLNEGLALYMENDADGSPKGDLPGGSPTPTEGELAHHRNDLFPLHALHGSFLGLSQADARLAYAESLSATRFFIRRYGLASLRRLLQMATTTNFEQAFEAVLREPYYQFESDWTASITRQRM